MNNKDNNSTGIPELKPCPFCGGEALFNEDGRGGYISCENSGLSDGINPSICSAFAFMLRIDGGSVPYHGISLYEHRKRRKENAIKIRNTRSDLPADSVQAGDVREAIEEIRGELAKGFYAPDKDKIEIIITAASIQSEVVTVEDLATLIYFAQIPEDSDGDKIMPKCDRAARRIMERYPKGLRIVSKNEDILTKEKT